MSRRNPLAWAVLVLALAAPGAASRAAAQSTDDDPNVTLNPGASFRRWTVTVSDSAGAESESKISQFYVPFGATVPLGPNFDFVAYGAFASTKLDLGDSGSGTLKGLTDFRLKGFWRPGNRMFLGLGISPPVGKHLLEQEPVDGQPGDLSEVEVAQAMWSPIFGLRAKQMDGGFDVDLSAGAAIPVSPTVTLGLGAGYIVKGEFDFVQTEDAATTFKPGSEASASIGLDIRPTESTLIRLDVAGRRFGDDTQSDRKVFHAANQIELDGSLAHNAGAWSLLLHARDVAKGKDEFIEEDGDAGLLRTQHTAASSFWASGELYRRLGDTFALGAVVEYGSFGKSDLTVSDGSTFSFGPALRLGRTGGSNALIRLSSLTGSAEGGDVDLSGFDVAGVVSLAF